jgi:hypothetical protein
LTINEPDVELYTGDKLFGGKIKAPDDVFEFANFFIHKSLQFLHCEMSRNIGPSIVPFKHSFFPVADSHIPQFKHFIHCSSVKLPHDKQLTGAVYGCINEPLVTPEAIPSDFETMLVVVSNEPDVVDFNAPDVDVMNEPDVVDFNAPDVDVMNEPDVVDFNADVVVFDDVVVAVFVDDSDVDGLKTDLA